MEKEGNKEIGRDVDRMTTDTCAVHLGVPAADLNDANQISADWCPCGMQEVVTLREWSQGGTVQREDGTGHPTSPPGEAKVLLPSLASAQLIYSHSRELRPFLDTPSSPSSLDRLCRQRMASVVK